MSIKSCKNCRAKWVCIDYECWIGLGEKEPNADICPYFLDDEEGDDK